MANNPAIIAPPKASDRRAKSVNRLTNALLQSVGVLLPRLLNGVPPLKTHIDTLADNTPKARRRIRRLGAADPADAQARARLNERKEAVWVTQARHLINTNQTGCEEAKLQLEKKGYR